MYKVIDVSNGKLIGQYDFADDAINRAAQVSDWEIWDEDDECVSRGTYGMVCIDAD